MAYELREVREKAYSKKYLYSGMMQVDEEKPYVDLGRRTKGRSARREFMRHRGPAWIGLGSDVSFRSKPNRIGPKSNGL